VTSTASRTVPKAGDHDRDDVRVARERLVQNLPAVHARQPQVGDRMSNAKSASVRGPLRRSGLFDAEAMIGEPFRHSLAEPFLVVD
jgi:hypothetical protein